MQKSLEYILRDISLDELPVEWQWQQDEIKRFSEEKSLFPFQQQSIENTLKTLWLWKLGNENAKYLTQCYKSNQIQNVEERDANRMGFWMATGSGKTLVIVKVIEMLSMLMKRGAIEEKKDILFLVYRDNLIDQFKKHVDEYNIHNPYKRINLFNLRDYENIKRENAITFSPDETNLFYYRADLFLEEKSTAKKIDPRNYYNNGNWFVLLDEAHRGDSSDSKLKNIYNNFSRNGFTFNFSATFTDDIDLKTCAFNFNLEKFTQEKFGKQIYVSGESIEGFREKDDFSDIEKQRVVLKTLILQTYINQHYKKIKKSGNGFYHKPLLLTITNTVNEIFKTSNEAMKQKSDLRLFFSEIEKIANNKIQKGLFNEAMSELEQEMKSAHYLFGSEKINIDKKIFSKIKYINVLEGIFNTKKSGSIEVIYIKGNKQEIAFKMTNSDKPFALIRIGEIDKWRKDVLSEGYEKTVHYDGKSFFEHLNQPDSNINILMGSRTFYEGWDSNRPNIILFVNIGLGKDARKFVLQSIGRGVRIEPEKGKKGRLQKLFNADMVDKNTYKAIQGSANALESLFVFGTNAENVEKIIKSLQSEKEKESFELGDEFGTNPYTKDKLLLVPVYEESNKTFVDKKVKYPISETDLDSVRKLFSSLSDKNLLVKYGNSSPNTLKKIRNKIKEMKKHHESRSIDNPELVAGNLLNFFNLRNEEFNKFDKLKEEHIVHFTKIKFNGEEKDFNDIRKKISIMKEKPKKQKELERLWDERKKDEFLTKNSLLEQAKEFEVEGYKFDIKHLARHCYHPLLVSHEEREIYLTHIIKVESERKFIKELETRVNEWDDKFDWWMFSKLDETLDKIYIPYYNGAQNISAKFHPDFIFWFENTKGYHILFIDPKGGAHTSYQYKADGYNGIFCDEGKEKILHEHGKDIKVYLRFFGSGIRPEGYEKYWIDEVSEIPKILDG